MITHTLSVKDSLNPKLLSPIFCVNNTRPDAFTFCLHVVLNTVRKMLHGKNPQTGSATFSGCSNIGLVGINKGKTWTLASVLRLNK